MRRDHAIALARKHAASSPHTYTKSVGFIPHEWVINAIMEAYEQGESDEFNRAAPEPPPGPVHKPKS